MEIPCRHLFKFWATKNIDLFQPYLCAKRWTKEYYYTSHPALNQLQHVLPKQPIHFAKVRVPSEMDKYKKSSHVTKDINNLVSNMSNSQFNYFMGKMNDIRSEMVGESRSAYRDIDITQNTSGPGQPDRLQNSLPPEASHQQPEDSTQQNQFPAVPIRPCLQRQHFLSHKGIYAPSSQPNNVEVNQLPMPTPQSSQSSQLHPFNQQSTQQNQLPVLTIQSSQLHPFNQQSAQQNQPPTFMSQSSHQLFPQQNQLPVPTHPSFQRHSYSQQVQP